MTTFHDISGQRFGRFTAISHFRKGRRTMWWCVCDCGTEKAVERSKLIGLKTQSCGCLRRETIAKIAWRHGAAERRTITSELQSYYAAKGRCYNANNASYADYGGRGITMCDAWLNDPAAFLRDMGPRPAGHSIERVDNNAPYSPTNCIWADAKQQNRNKRGVNPLIDTAEANGVSPRVLNDRVKRLGWSAYEAATIPVGMWRSQYYRAQSQR